MHTSILAKQDILPGPNQQVDTHDTPHWSLYLSVCCLSPVSCYIKLLAHFMAPLPDGFNPLLSTDSAAGRHHVYDLVF